MKVTKNVMNQFDDSLPTRVHVKWDDVEEWLKIRRAISFIFDDKKSDELLLWKDHDNRCPISRFKEYIETGPPDCYYILTELLSIIDQYNLTTIEYANTDEMQSLRQSIERQRSDKKIK